MQTGFWISGVNPNFGNNLSTSEVYEIAYDFNAGNVTTGDAMYIIPYDYDGFSLYTGSYFCDGSFVPPSGHYTFTYTPTMAGSTWTTAFAFNANATSTHTFILDNVSMCAINTVASYSPDIISEVDYYAFGQSMPGREWSAEDYRYGMNTQEKDNEIFKGAFGAKFWEYDSRIGRRWNMDPVLKIGNSPYSCFSDNPILNIDPNGDDDVTYNKNGTVKSVKERSRVYEFFFGAKGTVVDENGKTVQKFKFNDSRDAEKKNWVGENAKYKRLNIWSDKQTDALVKDRVANVKESSKIIGKLEAAKDAGHGDFDYSYDFRSDQLYVIGKRGYNKYDAGNYMTGVSYRALGWPKITILIGAQINSIKNANSDNADNPDYVPRKIGIQFDQSADQRALRHGANYGRKHRRELNPKDSDSKD
jgi:hypothetical protein